MKRKKPVDGDKHGWDDFEVYADANGIGEHPDDWGVELEALACRVRSRAH